MLTLKQYEEIKSKIADKISDNYDSLNCFLQRFYAINALRELVHGDEELSEEFDVLMLHYLDEIYTEKSFSGIVGKVTESINSDSRTAVTTMALLDTVFPEFLDGSFNPNTMSLERKEMASYIFESSNVYKYSTSDFRKGLKRIVDEPIKRPPLNKLKEVKLKIDENSLSL